MAAPASDDLRAFRTAWWHRLLDDRATYELARFAVVRSLALVYLVAFASLAVQLDSLLGSHGLLPAARYLEWLHHRVGAGAYWRTPTLFWFGCSDTTMRLCALAGVGLSAAALAGATNAILQALLWLLYLSFVHVGQIFYGYGWEIQLLETGFLAIFLCPVRTLAPLPATRTPRIVVWLLRWVVFRVMLGAGLIKLRNDPCWRDLTCLDFHFETQPNPNPLSWWLHRAPHGVHVAGVVVNHVVEIVAPWFALFGQRRWRHAAGAAMVGFQVVLIASGNLSFLNWLTIVPALACFDDEAWSRLVPARWRGALLERARAAIEPCKARMRAVQVLGVVVALLSVMPAVNLASCDQEMNRSYDPLDLVNTYGAFGGMDRERYEVLLEGTRDDDPADDANWREYQLPCMPGDPKRRPCVVTPWQWRLDWQMWFVGNGAARGEDIEDEPWLVHLVWQILEGEPAAKRLLALDPFPDAPPRWVRMTFWRYRFTTDLRDGWWRRERIGVWVRPLSIDDRLLRDYLRAFGWTR